MHRRSHSAVSVEHYVTTPSVPTHAHCHGLCGDAPAQNAREGCGVIAHRIRWKCILFLVFFMSGALLWPGTFTGRALNAESEIPIPRAQDESGSGALTMSQRRVKYHACVRAGKHECFKRMQTAVDWCMKNPDQCRSLLVRGRISAQAYGDQVGDECRVEQETKCRRKWGL